MSSCTPEEHSNLRQRVGLMLGPVLAAIILVLPPMDAGNPLVSRTAAVAVLMAVWWLTEALPIPATALLPVPLFPLLGIMDGRSTAATYFNSVIFLFVGGFLMALAMQRWQLHRRIALRILLLIGGGPGRILLGFMAATAFLSMWISNTAAAMMMVPIAMAVVSRLREGNDSPAMSRFAAGLLIGIAYAASIGGIATLIGTPPNLAFSQIFHMTFPAAPEITFADWMLFGTPCAILLLAAAWGVLRVMFVHHAGSGKGGTEEFRQEYRELGRMKSEERVILVLFAAMALLWFFRQDIALGSMVVPGWSRLLEQPKFADDGTVAVLVASLLFLIPSRSKRGERLLDWATAHKLQWGIVLLFGGGFALAAGFKESGLSAWVASQLTGLSGVPSLVMVTSVSTLMTFLTELTSNTATTQIVLPLLGSLAVALQVNPLLLMIPATLSASCAFMLPVATPPNAIIFGTGEVKMTDLMRSGIVMNLVGIVLIVALIFIFGLALFGIGSGCPDWVR